MFGARRCDRIATEEIADLFEGQSAFRSAMGKL
jgi:hypothetical protein